MDKPSLLELISCKKEYLYMKERTSTLINLADTINRIIEKVQPTITQKIIFDKELNPVLFIDEVVFQNIIRIFIENASKLSPSQSTIKVNILRRGDSIDVTVADEGKSFVDEEKEKVSTPSSTINTFSFGEKTPLKLTVINKYAESFGAWSFLSDNFPKGNVFHIVFNLNQEKS
jgi:signal transduction histidine kinase